MSARVCRHDPVGAPESGIEVFLSNSRTLHEPVERTIASVRSALESSPYRSPVDLLRDANGVALVLLRTGAPAQARRFLEDVIAVINEAAEARVLDIRLGMDSQLGLLQLALKSHIADPVAELTHARAWLETGRWPTAWALQMRFEDRTDRAATTAARLQVAFVVVSSVFQQLLLEERRAELTTQSICVLRTWSRLVARGLLQPVEVLIHTPIAFGLPPFRNPAIRERADVIMQAQSLQARRTAGESFTDTMATASSLAERLAMDGPGPFPTIADKEAAQRFVNSYLASPNSSQGAGAEIVPRQAKPTSVEPRILADRIQARLVVAVEESIRNKNSSAG